MVEEHQTEREKANPSKLNGCIYHILLYICNAIIFICKYSLKLLFSRKLIPDHSKGTSFEGYSKKNMKKEETKTLNLFGYEASKNVIILFCILILLTYILVKTLNIDVPPLKGLITNSITSIALAILVLIFLDEILPCFIFWLLNKVIRLRTKIFRMLGII